MMDETWMRRTFQLATLSAEAGFDPFGAVLVREGSLVAETRDRCIDYSDPTAHAELVLISEFCRQRRLISLEGYALYCNVEPCIMCSGAIHWARLDRVVFGVAQYQLQGVSGGNQKPSCPELINPGKQKIVVDGPLLDAEGLEVLHRYPFRSKKDRHKKFWGT